MTKNQARTTIRIREDLFLKLKLLATIRHEHLSDVLNEAIEKYIQEHEDEIKKIPEVVMKNVRNGG
jgi:predicted DNA-binding protein